MIFTESKLPDFSGGEASTVCGAPIGLKTASEDRRQTAAV
jgi:hypothetical protein